MGTGGWKKEIWPTSREKFRETKSNNGNRGAFKENIKGFYKAIAVEANKLELFFKQIGGSIE